MEDDKYKGLTPQQIKDSKALSGCETPEKLNYDLTKEDKDSIRVDYRNSNYKLIEIPYISHEPEQQMLTIVERIGINL